MAQSRHSNFKTKLLNQLNGLAKLAKKNPKKSDNMVRKAFTKYPIALKTIGISDAHYYKNASEQVGFMNKNQSIQKGFYPIADVDTGGFSNARTDNMSSTKLLNYIKSFKHNAKDYYSSDLKDMYLANDTNISATTSPNFEETDYKKLYDKNQKATHTKQHQFHHIFSNKINHIRHNSNFIHAKPNQKQSNNRNQKLALRHNQGMQR